MWLDTPRGTRCSAPSGCSVQRDVPTGSPGKLICGTNNLLKLYRRALGDAAVAPYGRLAARAAGSSRRLNGRFRRRVRRPLDRRPPLGCLRASSTHLRAITRRRAPTATVQQAHQRLLWPPKRM